MTTINAFHPDYVKTYMQEFIKSIKVQNRHQMSSQHMTEYTDEIRKTKPSHGTITGITKPLHVNRAPLKMVISTKQRVDLAPREFKIYSRAGTANVTPKGKK